MDNASKVILSVLAHPDDETFGMGGTLALYARQGAKVYLVCATRGEVGEMDEEYMRGFNSIGERREAELRCAAEKLGLTEVFFLGYRDSGMPGSADNSHPQALAAAPLEEVAAKVAHTIRLLKPQVVLTFDPIGGYRHPDHIAIQQATVRAFETAADPAMYPDDLPAFRAQRLFFHTIPHGFLKFGVWFLKLIGKDPTKFGKNKDIDLAALVAFDFPTHARINYGPVAKIRAEASACHASQGGGKGGGFMNWLERLLGSSDTFMQAFPEPGKKVITDLFVGL